MGPRNVVCRGRTWTLPIEDEKTMRRFDDLANSITMELRVRDAILDGEIVVLGEGGPKFYALMMSRESASYVAFDLLWRDGRDLRARPLWRPKGCAREARERDACGVRGA